LDISARPPLAIRDDSFDRGFYILSSLRGKVCWWVCQPLAGRGE